jgi:diguanylate cyclase (GGDEF)-like protein/PAS domain S-box-containing protein
MVSAVREMADPTASRWGARLRTHALDPTVLSLPVVAVVFCLLRWRHIIAPEPYWLYVLLVVGGGALRIVYSSLWAEGRRLWHRAGYIAASTAVTGVVAYSTGWGPILSIGFLFGAAAAFDLFGSRATRPELVCTAVAVAIGQLAIALGLAPSIIHGTKVHGVAGLGLLGALLVIQLLGRAAANREVLELELRRSERRFSALVTSSGDIVIIAGVDRDLQYASPAFTAVLGYPSAAAFNLLGERLVHPDDQDGLDAALNASVETDAVVSHELRLRTIAGEWLWFEAAISNLTNDPDVNGYVANLRDITRRKDAEDKLAHAALHDSLTGLPNRALILNRTEQMLARARREETPIAALFLDLDDFKDINDTLGHEAGDQLLAAMASRMSGILRAGDTVGRLGGDEFIILVEGASLAAGAEVVAERIRDVLRTPFQIAASAIPLEVTASIGIAEGDREQAGDLLRDADIALYRAKAAGKDCAITFSLAMQHAVQEHRHIEVDLHHALDRGEFFLMYQPTVDLATGIFNGVEALLRWRHPERGVMLPDDFIPALESSSAIVPVGEWVLHQACRQGSIWSKQGFPIRVSVNISAVQLERDRIIDDVHSALERSGFEPGLLSLELSELTLMRDVEETLIRLKLLKAVGVRLAIDDFGTGYSSLGYLRQFPIDALKIDQSFVAGLATSKESATIVHTLVQLGKALGLETVAEGIECQDQRRQMEAEEVTIGQGFLFARPLTVDGVERLLREGDVTLGDRPVMRPRPRRSGAPGT